MSADAIPANNTNESAAMAAPPPRNQPAFGGPGLQGGEPSGTVGGRGGRQQHNRNRRPPPQRYQGGDGGDASGGNPQQDHRRQHGHPQQQQPYRHDQRHHHEGGGGGGRRQRADEGGSSTTDFAPRNAKFLRKHHVKDRSDHGGVQMTGRVHECLICCQSSDLFGVGACLHPACMECCIRMRICGESDTCPQCRSPIEVMYFAGSPNDWKSFELPRLTVPHRDTDKYRIRFESDYAVQCYESYMAHNCHVCQKRGNPPSFGTFGALRHHMGQEHELSFCHICCENLNVLTKDRKTYSKTELQQHMQGKNRGEDGFHGHPKCLFCEQRFFDDEQQYRHLRREHYFCQICDTDGAANVFYARAHQLQRHYEKEHFPCQDPDCVSMGIVFRSEFDLKLHRQSHPSEGGRRAIPLDIQFNNTSRAHGPMRPATQHGDVVTSVPGGSARIALVQTPQQAAPVRPDNVRIVPSALTQARQQRIVRSAASQLAPQGTEHPTLSGGGMTGQREPAPYGAPPGWRQQVQQMRSAQAPPATISSGEQFPSLGPSATSGSKPAGSNTVWGKAKTQDLFKNVAPPRPRPSAQEQQKRKPVIPTPDIWPEHIRKKMEARAAGLTVEEEQDPILRAEEHFTAEEKAKRAAKKKAKKQVSASAVTNKLEETPLPSTSKFQTLGAYDEGAEEVDSDDKSGWWSAKVKAGKTTAQQTTTLRPTSDDFVQIDTGSIPVTLRSVAASIAPQKENIPVAKPSAKEFEQLPKDGKPAKGTALDSWEDDISLYDLNDPTPPPKADEQSEVEKALQNWEDDLSLYDLSDPSDPNGGAQPSLSFTNIVSNMFGWTFGGAGAGPQPLSKGQKKRQKQKAKEAATGGTSSDATKTNAEDGKTGSTSTAREADSSSSDADLTRAWSSGNNEAPPGFSSKLSSQDYPSLSSNGGPPPPGFSPNRSSKNTPPPPGFEKNNAELEID